MAAFAWIALIQNAELGFLLRDGFLRRKVRDVQMPRLLHFVAVGVGLLEVIAGIEEKHGNLGLSPAEQIEDDHVLSLKTARDARLTGIIGKNAFDQRIGRKEFELFSERDVGHLDSPLT